MNIREFAKKLPLLRRIILSVRRLISPSRSDLLGKLKMTQHDTLIATLQAISEVNSTCSFVKVGANDGVTGDPCGDFLLANQNWRGLLIEPVEYCVEKLKAVYSDSSRFTIAQAAIGSRQERRPFYYLAKEAKEIIPELPIWYDQLGSFDRAHILKHFEYDIAQFIVEEMVDVAPLHLILMRHHFPKPNFLHIDTEGFDLEVLRSFDFSSSLPDAILVEHKHLNDSDLSSMLKILKKNLYIVVNTGSDFLGLTAKANNAVKASFYSGSSA